VERLDETVAVQAPAIAVPDIQSARAVGPTVSTHCSLIQHRNANHCELPFLHPRHSTLPDHCTKETASLSRPIPVYPFLVAVVVVRRADQRVVGLFLRARSTNMTRRMRLC